MTIFRSAPPLAALLALAVAPGLRAHDPSESWTEVIVHADQIEVLVTMAQITALKLIDPAAQIAGLTEQNFPQHRAKLLAEGAKLFILTAGSKSLPVSKVEVEFTEETDVAYKLIFPRPSPGTLTLEAAFIKKLGAGFGGVIDATDADGRHLGWDQLSPEEATLVVTLTKPGERPAKKN